MSAWTYVPPAPWLFPGNPEKVPAASAPALISIIRAALTGSFALLFAAQMLSCTPRASTQTVPIRRQPAIRYAANASPAQPAPFVERALTAEPRPRLPDVMQTLPRTLWENIDEFCIVKAPPSVYNNVVGSRRL